MRLTTDRLFLFLLLGREKVILKRLFLLVIVDEPSENQYSTFTY